MSLSQAQTEVSVIATRLAQRYPEVNKDVRFNVTPLRQDLAGVARRPLIVLLGAALGLLLIGCCNLVNLLLARALTRNRETAVRSALGATQSRLIRQAAAELLPILALGSLLGVLAAKWGIKLMIPWLPAALPRIEEIEVNLPVLLFSGTRSNEGGFATDRLPQCRSGRWPGMDRRRGTLRRDYRTGD